MANAKHFSRICILSVSTFGFLGAIGCSDLDHDADSRRPQRVERIETTTIQQPAPRTDGRYQDRLEQDRIERDRLERERLSRLDRNAPPAPAERLDRRGVPRDAMMIQEGSGSMNLRATDRGTIYLYDVDDARVVWSGDIDRGERFAIDPDANSAMINGRLVYRDDTVRRHRHQVFMDTNPR